MSDEGPLMIVCVVSCAAPAAGSERPAGEWTRLQQSLGGEHAGPRAGPPRAPRPRARRRHLRPQQRHAAQASTAQTNRFGRSRRGACRRGRGRRQSQCGGGGQPCARSKHTTRRRQVRRADADGRLLEARAGRQAGVTPASHPTPCAPPACALCPRRAVSPRARPLHRPVPGPGRSGARGRRTIADRF